MSGCPVCHGSGLRNRFCKDCWREEGRLVIATDVDHVIPHRGDERLMWDEKNWQGLCARHHGIKTAREDGGFGR